MATKTTKTQLTPMVVTTQKGVFFGYGMPSDDKTVTLERAHMCIYWSADMRGVTGLAAIGPNNGCKISPQVPKMTIQDITLVVEATPEAAANWAKAGERKWA